MLLFPKLMAVNCFGLWFSVLIITFYLNGRAHYCELTLTNSILSIQSMAKLTDAANLFMNTSGIKCVKSLMLY